jgi:hypothetical protein
VSFGYSVATSGLEEITGKFLRTIEAEVKCSTYHLVGHSLGNVIIRNGFKTGYPSGLGRIVMLAPPNQPAELARVLRENKIYKVLTGDAGQKLGDERFYESLPVPDVPFGIIAGDAAHTGLFKVPSDGVITVESTKLNGMADWAVVHHTHTFLMDGSDTFERVRSFLQAGRFRSTPR